MSLWTISSGQQAPFHFPNQKLRGRTRSSGQSQVGEGDACVWLCGRMCEALLRVLQSPSLPHCRVLSTWAGALGEIQSCLSNCSEACSWVSWHLGPCRHQCRWCRGQPRCSCYLRSMLEETCFIETPWRPCGWRSLPGIAGENWQREEDDTNPVRKFTFAAQLSPRL